jgi:hypothetical protein
MGVLAAIVGDVSEFMMQEFENPPSRDSELVSERPNWRGFLAFWKDILRMAD